MKNSIYNILAFACLMFFMFGNIQAENFNSAFQNAYQTYPDVPKGVLEAVAFNNTRFKNINADTEPESCMGLPFYNGVMGLVFDGKGYFRENLKLIAEWSNSDAEQIKNNPEAQIEAYAAAWQAVQSELPESWSLTEKTVYLLEYFSEIPLESNLADNFALSSQLYVYFLFLNDEKKQAEFDFPNHQFDLEQIFGKENLKVLSANQVQVIDTQVISNTGNQYRRRMSADYPLAIWNPTTCNFNSRGGVEVSSVTVHTVQGSYAGAISWFKNCNANVSAHYVIRSVDGQVTQVVSEADRAWHVGTENSYTIGLEHEGYVSDSSWYTAAMYNSSADLVKNIISRPYDINSHSTYRGTSQAVLNECYRIKGHVHYINQTHTDPGVYWDWDFYHYLINTPLAALATYTDCSGIISDTTGGNNYGDLERYYQVIDPGVNGPLTLSFNDFDTEDGYDFLYVYDGDNIQGTPLASLSGNQIPADITAPSGKMTLLFESDCLINGRGWSATWTCTGCNGNIAIQLDSMQGASCSSTSSTGLLQVSTQGGDAPYSYEWSNGVQDSVNSGLQAGIYTLTVEDALGCFTSASFTLSSDSVLSFNRVLEHSGCYGANAGEVIYEITEGVAPFTYQWSNGANAFMQKNLGPGAYSVSITDARNCVQIDTFTINEADAPLELDSIKSDYGLSFYKLNPVGVRGGTPPYAYLWSNGDQTAEAFVNESGVYELEISDANDCVLRRTVLVDFPTNINNLQAADLKIFPVPFEEQLNIQGINTDQLNISIHNTLGQEIYRNNSDLDQLQISTAHWPSGVYFVYLKDDKGSKVLSRKVLKF